MLKVGITGGIGSGKSLICKVFELLGIPVFNSDSEAKNIMNSDQEVMNNLKDLLGTKAYNNNGLNRDFLRQTIFKNRNLLEKINTIVHPAVRKYFRAWCEHHTEYPYVIQEAAILFESGASQQLDRIITIYSPEHIRIKRTVDRDGTSVEEVKRIIEKQMPDSEKIKRSDAVIYNYDPYMVLPQVVEIYNNLISLSSNLLI